jgi:hypothetical protein
MIVSEYSNSKNVTVSVSGISPEAVAYLKRICRNMRNDGVPMTTTVEYATVWTAAYRTGYANRGKPAYSAAAYLDGFRFAHGEQMYNECMAVDTAQDSADAANWPAGF